VLRVRRASDWLRAGLPCCGLLALLVGAQVASSQENKSQTENKSETIPPVDKTVPQTTIGPQTPTVPQTSETQQTNEKIQELAALARTHAREMPIGPGDVIHVDVFDIPELSRDLRVSDTGEISFPLIRDRIPVAGLTPYQLQSKFEKILMDKGLVAHPNVTISVVQQTSEPIQVVGAVNHTMTYQVTKPTTLLEVLAAAGGVSDTAGDTVIITRPEFENTAQTKPVSESTSNLPQEQKIIIRLRDLLETGDTVYNIQVYGGDTITVPPAGVVYVLGFGVAQPGGYVLNGHGEQITVLQMIALARGFTNFAKPDDAVILRKNPATGQRDTIPVRLKEIQKLKIPDVVLLSNVSLYVPDSRGKKALARGTEAALSIGTSVAIYHVY